MSGVVVSGLSQSALSKYGMSNSKFHCLQTAQPLKKTGHKCLQCSETESMGNQTEEQGPIPNSILKKILTDIVASLAC
jgi:hypothetical protein